MVSWVSLIFFDGLGVGWGDLGNGENPLAVPAMAGEVDVLKNLVALAVAEFSEPARYTHALDGFFREPGREDARAHGELAHLQAGPLLLGVGSPHCGHERRKIPMLPIQHLEGVAGLGGLAQLPAIAVVLAHQARHGRGLLHAHAALVEITDGEFEDLLDAPDAGQHRIPAGAADRREDFRGHPLAEGLRLRLARFEDQRVEARLGDANGVLHSSDGVGNADAISFILLERLDRVTVVGDIQSSAHIGSDEPRLPCPIERPNRRAFEIKSQEF
jgi:hypothetical protein